MTFVKLAPENIRYTQDSILRRFQNGSLIGEVLDDLVGGKLYVEDVPAMTVMEKEGQFFSYNNRRLWVLKQYQNMGKCTTVKVKMATKSLPHDFTANNGGKEVRIRGGGPGGSSYFDLFGGDSNCESSDDVESDEDEIECDDDEPNCDEYEYDGYCNGNEDDEPDDYEHESDGNCDEYDDDEPDDDQHESDGTCDENDENEPDDDEYESDGSCNEYYMDEPNYDEYEYDDDEYEYDGYFNEYDEDIPALIVMEKEGQFFSHNNRRLWVMKQYQKKGKCTTAKVNKATRSLPHAFTAKHGGKEVRIRGGGHGGFSYFDLRGRDSNCERSDDVESDEDENEYDDDQPNDDEYESDIYGNEYDDDEPDGDQYKSDGHESYYDDDEKNDDYQWWLFWPGL